MVGQTQRPWVRQNPTSCLTQCQTEKKKFSPTLRNIYKKQHGARPCVEKMQLIFFVPPKGRVRDCTPKNLDVPPKMKVKRYMYPQGLAVIFSHRQVYVKREGRTLFLLHKVKVEFQHLFSLQKRFSLCSSHRINANIDVFC